MTRTTKDEPGPALTDGRGARVRGRDGRSAAGAAGPWSFAWILTAAFVSGAAVMLVEVVGTRVLTPFFGVGLYVWSALLVVTLGALSAGYYVGGRIADRHAGVLPLQLLGAAAWMALAPILRVPVLRALDGADLRVGALVSASVLFGPTLGAMGMVSTTAVKFAILGDRATGRAAGLVYALSTLGSLFGTLMAGFWLVPTFPVGGILWGTAVALALMGLSGLRRGLWVKAVPLMILALLLPAIIDQDSARGPFQVLERRASLYGNLSVVEDTAHDVPLRLLRADHSFIGAEWEGGEPAFGFVHLLEASALAEPRAARALLIGLGVGSVVPFLQSQGMLVDVVELDPQVVDLAREYFEFQTRGTVFAEDARTWLRTQGGTYDIIIHDTFTGGATPEHLLSVEVMRALRRRLAPGGLMVLNLVGATDGSLSGATRAVARTISEVFAHVRLFRDGPPKRDGDLQNLVFFASGRPVRFDLKAVASVSSLARRQVFVEFQNWEVAPRPAGGPLITDEHNPIARLATGVSERHHALMRQLYPAEFWLR